MLHFANSGSHIPSELDPKFDKISGFQATSRTTGCILVGHAKSKINYSVSERQRFPVIIIKPFTVKSDHHSLCW